MLGTESTELPLEKNPIALKGPILSGFLQRRLLGNNFSSLESSEYLFFMIVVAFLI